MIQLPKFRKGDITINLTDTKLSHIDYEKIPKKLDNLAVIDKFLKKYQYGN
jgi:hypothetical protein